MEKNSGIEVLMFYLHALLKAPSSNAVLVFLGFLVRASSVFIFALTIKVFLIVIDPSFSLALVSSVASEFGFSQLGESELVTGSLIVLLALVILQFVLNRCYEYLFLKNRNTLVEYLIENPLVDGDEFHVHVCLDRVPVGFESIIKSLEICLFYASLILIIYWISPVMAASVVVLLLLIVYLMLMKTHERSETMTAAYEARAKVKSASDDVAAGLALTDLNFITARRTATYSELFGGAGIVIVMLLYLYWQDHVQLTSSSLVTLFLVLSIRFVIGYTGELSRLISTIVQQQDMMGLLRRRRI